MTKLFPDQEYNAFSPEVSCREDQFSLRQSKQQHLLGCHSIGSGGGGGAEPPPTTWMLESRPQLCSVGIKTLIKV